MKLVQRGGSIPETKQEVIDFRAHTADAEIQRMIERYAVRVVAVCPFRRDTTEYIMVIFEEE